MEEQLDISNKYTHFPVVRCSKKFKEAIYKYAKEHNMSFSSMLREALIKTYGVTGE